MIIVIINISITKKPKFPRGQKSTFLEKSKALWKVPSIKLWERTSKFLMSMVWSRMEVQVMEPEPGVCGC